MEFEESRLQQPEVDFSFPRENIELIEVLGCGNFGQVYKAIAKDILEVGITTPVAVKILKSKLSNFKMTFWSLKPNPKPKPWFLKGPLT